MKKIIYLLIPFLFLTTFSFSQTYLYCSECYNLPVIVEVSYNDCNKIILEYNLKDN